MFVIALVPDLFFGGKPDETCCHSVVASKWLETLVSHFALQDENTTTQTQTEIIKSLAVQRMKQLEFTISNKSTMTMLISWVTSLGKLIERPKGKKL